MGQTQQGHSASVGHGLGHGMGHIHHHGDLDRFEHHVEEMYSILLNISSELLSIKSMMKANRKLAAEHQQLESKTEGKDKEPFSFSSFLRK